MHVRNNILFLIVILLSVFLLGVLASTERFKNRHVLYYVPEMGLFVRLSPSCYYPRDEVLVFTKDRDLLPTNNLDDLKDNLDNIFVISNPQVMPAIYVRSGIVDTFYVDYAFIPHSVSIPMEELFEMHHHHLPNEIQQQLSDLPFFS